MGIKEKYTFIVNTYPSKLRDKELPRTLKSIFNQSYDDHMVLLVENYKDLSRLNPLLKKHSFDMSRLKLINDSKKKLSHLFEIGWRNAQTELLAYVADDVELEPDWLENAHKELTSDDSIGVVTGPIISTTYPTGEMHRLYLISQKNIFFRILVWPYLHFAMEGKVLAPGNLFESGAYSLGAALPEAKDFPRQEIDLATTSSMVIKISVLEEVGGFDTRFNFNHADGDLFIRIKKVGYKVIFNPKVISHHHLRMGSSRNAYIIGLDTGIFYRKHIRPKSFKGVIGVFLNTLLLNFYWVYNAIRTRDANQLKGISGFIKGLLGYAK